jgi:hypothetical protein
MAGTNPSPADQVDIARAPLEARARARAAALRQQAEQIRIAAERQITGLLTAAEQIEALLQGEEAADDPR